MFPMFALRRCGAFQPLSSRIYFKLILLSILQFAGTNINMISKGKLEDADAIVSWIEEGAVDLLNKGLLRM